MDVSLTLLLSPPSSLPPPSPISSAAARYRWVSLLAFSPLQSGNAFTSNLECCSLVLLLLLLFGGSINAAVPRRAVCTGDLPLSAGINFTIARGRPTKRKKIRATFAYSCPQAARVPNARSMCFTVGKAKMTRGAPMMRGAKKASWKVSERSVLD